MKTAKLTRITNQLDLVFRERGPVTIKITGVHEFECNLRSIRRFGDRVEISLSTPLEDLRGEEPRQ